jgi:hypothetical protein
MNYTDGVLGGHRFGSGVQNGSANFYASVSGACPQGIVVNGINTSSDAAAVSRSGIERVLNGAGLSCNVNWYNVYNSSAKYVEGGKLKCAWRSIQALHFLDVLKCTGIFGDVLQAEAQINSIINKLPKEAEPEAKVLAKYIRDERAAGRPVLIVPHSQGNLMVIEALKDLPLDECVSVIALASPTGKASFSGVYPGNLDGFVIAGNSARDVILDLGYNDFDRIQTEVSRDADRIAESYVNTAGVSGFVQMVEQDIRLHSMLESYLDAKEARDKFTEIVKTQVTKLYSNASCNTPPTEYLYSISGGINQDGTSRGPSYLWKVSTYANGKDLLIGKMRTVDGGEPAFTDIVRVPGKWMWGIADERLYIVDTLTAVVYEQGFFTNTNGINALAVDAKGQMYTADKDGAVSRLNPEANAINWKGSFGSGLKSAGDMAFSPGGELFATVETSSGENYLASIDLSTGRATMMPRPIGFSGVWGLGFVGNTLYGFTAPQGFDRGSLITINRTSGEGVLVRHLDFLAFGAGIRMKWEIKMYPGAGCAGVFLNLPSY